MSYWLRSCFDCIVWLLTVVYWMVVLHTYRPIALTHSFVVFVSVPSYCTILLVEHSFFTWVASQCAIRLLWQPSLRLYNYFLWLTLLYYSVNKYDDDDKCVFAVELMRSVDVRPWGLSVNWYWIIGVMRSSQQRCWVNELKSVVLVTLSLVSTRWL